MKISHFVLLLIGLSFSNKLVCQESASKFEFNGYLSAMPQYMWSDSLRYKQGLLHNRLNFAFFPTENIIFTAQFRNQLLYGDFVEMGYYEDGFISENYFLPLTFQQTFNSQGLLYISADRLWMQYSKNKIEINIGRQRINWGQTFVWNPNDIFNAYNFFDFDYAERPGADALRLQYYPNETSQLDFATKIDSGNNVTSAALYRINYWGYDFQFIAGYYSQPYQSSFNDADKESDWVGGFAFTGDYNGISLRTEASYLYPTKESPNQDDLFIVSAGVDYTFINNLNSSAEFMFSSDINLPSGSNFFSLYTGPMTVKTLAFTKYSIFAQSGYPVTPLMNATLSGILFLDTYVNGYYIGPSLSYSVMENLELSGFFQFFRFRIENPLNGDIITSTSNLAFIRVKWNF